MRWHSLEMLRRFLQLQDRNGFVAGIAGILGLVTGMLALFFSGLLLTALGLHAMLAFPIVVSVFFWPLLLMYHVFLLVLEWMWTICGLYAIFDVKGRPLRRSAGDWLDKRRATT